MQKRLLIALILAAVLGLASFGCSGGSSPATTTGNYTSSPLTTSVPVTTTSPVASNVTLTVIVDGGGQVTPGAGKYTYPKGTVVNLAAIGDIHWTFNLWLGLVSDSHSATTTITLSSDQTITAYFSATMD